MNTVPVYLACFLEDFFRTVYLEFLSLGLISGLKEMFRQEGVIGFFRGKFEVTLFWRTQSNLY